MADIFLSYRRGLDEAGRRRAGSDVTAQELSALLRRVGWSVWYDNQLEPADEWESRVWSELDSSRCVLGLWSAGANDPSSFVLREFERAAKQRKLIVIRMDSDPIPDAFRSLQAAHVTNFSLVNQAPQVQRVVRAIAKFCGIPHRFEGRLDLLLHDLLDRDFGGYRIGNISIPTRVLVGVPEEQFRFSDVICVDKQEIHENRPSYPAIIKENFDYLFQEALRSLNVEGKDWRDNPMVRLDRFEQAPEGPNDERGGLTLYTSRTSYFKIWATNVAIDIPYFDKELNDKTTIREAFCSPPFDLDDSILANNPGIEVMLVSSSSSQSPSRQLIIRQRRQTVAGYRGWFQSSASGHFSAAHTDKTGCPSPFAGAVAEVRQEIDSNLILDPDAFRLFGICLKHQDLHPSFFGFIETEKRADDLCSAVCRDSYEGKKSAIPLDPDAIIQHIASHRWFPPSALTAIWVLLNYYPFEVVEAAAKRISPITADYFEWGTNRVRDAL